MTSVLSTLNPLFEKNQTLTRSIYTSFGQAGGAGSASDADTARKLEDEEGVSSLQIEDGRLTWEREGVTLFEVSQAGVLKVKSLAPGVVIPAEDLQGITKTEADERYMSKEAGLTKNDASKTYLSQTTAADAYLTKFDAKTLYLTQETATAEYLTKDEAAQKYLTEVNLGDKVITASPPQFPNLMLRWHKHTSPDEIDLELVYNHEVVASINHTGLGVFNGSVHTHGGITFNGQHLLADILDSDHLDDYSDARGDNLVYTAKAIQALLAARPAGVDPAALADYLTQADAAETYLAKSDATETYLTKEDAESIYLTKETAADTYVNKDSANHNYLTQVDGDSRYLPSTCPDWPSLTLKWSGALDNNPILELSDGTKTAFSVSEFGHAYFRAVVSCPEINCSTTLTLPDENILNGLIRADQLDSYSDARGDTRVYSAKAIQSLLAARPSGVDPAVLADYLTRTDAADTYLAQTDATATYLAQTDATTTYLTKADAGVTYLAKTDAATTYLTQEKAESDYLTKASAEDTYVNKNKNVVYWEKQRWADPSIGYEDANGKFHQLMACQEEKEDGKDDSVAKLLFKTIIEFGSTIRSVIKEVKDTNETAVEGEGEEEETPEEANAEEAGEEEVIETGSATTKVASFVTKEFVMPAMSATLSCIVNGFTYGEDQIGVTYGALKKAVKGCLPAKGMMEVLKMGFRTRKYDVGIDDAFRFPRKDMFYIAGLERRDRWNGPLDEPFDSPFNDYITIIPTAFYSTTDFTGVTDHHVGSIANIPSRVMDIYLNTVFHGYKLTLDGVETHVDKGSYTFENETDVYFKGVRIYISGSPITIDERVIYGFALADDVTDPTKYDTLQFTADSRLASYAAVEACVTKAIATLPPAGITQTDADARYLQISTAQENYLAHSHGSRLLRWAADDTLELMGGAVRFASFGGTSGAASVFGPLTLGNTLSLGGTVLSRAAVAADVTDETRYATLSAVQDAAVATYGAVEACVAKAIANIPPSGITQAAADMRYLQISDAATTYLTQTQADTRYVQSVNAEDIYVPATYTTGDFNYRLRWVEDGSLLLERKQLEDIHYSRVAVFGHSCTFNGTLELCNTIIFSSRTLRDNFTTHDTNIEGILSGTVMRADPAQILTQIDDNTLGDGMLPTVDAVRSLISKALSESGVGRTEPAEEGEAFVPNTLETSRLETDELALGGGSLTGVVGAGDLAGYSAGDADVYTAGAVEARLAGYLPTATAASTYLTKTDAADAYLRRAGTGDYPMRVMWSTATMSNYDGGESYTGNRLTVGSSGSISKTLLQLDDNGMVRVGYNERANQALRSTFYTRIRFANQYGTYGNNDIINVLNSAHLASYDASTADNFLYTAKATEARLANYLTTASAASDYLTKAEAASTYATAASTGRPSITSLDVSNLDTLSVNVVSTAKITNSYIARQLLTTLAPSTAGTRTRLQCFFELACTLASANEDDLVLAADGVHIQLIVGSTPYELGITPTYSSTTSLRWRTSGSMLIDNSNKERSVHLQLKRSKAANTNWTITSSADWGNRLEVETFPVATE